MFTGIIQAIGHIQSIEHANQNCRVQIHTGKLSIDDVTIGDSIAVNGVCLTAIQWLPQGFIADLSAETLARTTFATATIDQPVNLEKCLTPTTALGGHFVTGHIDGIAEIIKCESIGNSLVMSIKLPADLARFVALKGSVTVDGVSLTVSDIQQTIFSVALVPHTLQQTTLQYVKPSSQVNIEVDIIARYVARLLACPAVEQKKSSITAEFLAEHGFNLQRGQ